MSKRKKRGEIPKVKVECRNSVNLTASENSQFLTLYELSGVYSKSAFIKARLFDQTFRVIKVDRTLLDYYQKLSALFGQFRAIGVNYNQVTVALKSNFTEKKAHTLLSELSKQTLDLVVIGGEIVKLTNEFKQEWSQK